jgi:hypothetical protein
MSPTGKSHSIDCNNDHSDTMAIDSDISNDNNDMEGSPPPTMDALSSTSDDDDSDPVMISPNITPEKSSLFVTSTDDNEQKLTKRSAGFSQDEVSSTTTVPMPSFVVTGLNRKSSLWQVKNWIALSLTLDGRDKITKTLQYVSRLLAWWFLVMGTSKNNSASTMTKRFHQHQAMRFTSLYQALSSSRKAFRLGRSITEAHKIASVGLIGLWCWHLKRHIDRMEGKDSDQIDKVSLPSKTSSHGESSNVGERPMTPKENNGTVTESTSRSLMQSFSSMAYRNICRPLISRVSSTLAVVAASETPTVELWMATGSALKVLGLLGFWLGDNVSFVTSNGGLDNYNLSSEDRLARRKKWQAFASNKANQAYFVGAIAGLVTNACEYYRFRRGNLAQAKQQYQKSFHSQQHDALGNEEMEKEEEQQQQHALKQLQMVQEKQFTLLLGLLKSCADVTAFSNNPGVDLHQKLRGKKNNEGLHCLCGLISAGAVLYNNFPDAKQ